MAKNMVVYRSIKGKIRPIKVTPNYGVMSGAATGAGILASKKRHKTAKKLRRAGFYTGLAGFGTSLTGTFMVGKTIAKQAVSVGMSGAWDAASSTGKKKLMKQAMTAKKSTLRKAAKAAKYGKIVGAVGMGMWLTGLAGQVITKPRRK